MKRTAAGLGLAMTLSACGSDGIGEPTPNPSPSGGTAACSATPMGGQPALTTTLFARGFANPVDFQVPPGERARAFVVEQVGRIRVVRGGNVLGTPFLDIVSRVGSGGERGLLGLAFHPRYSENGRFFVNYTDRGGDTHIAEFRASPPTADAVDPSTEREILFVDQPFANHNGGGLAFGPDGMLYVALGDGGSGGDPLRFGQDLGTPLGKMLRLDVDRGTPFAVPTDNPFLARPGAFPAIWAYGLRNPWRFAFDRSTGDLFIADVGQSTIEEVSVALAPRRGGENYGWSVMEGSRCFRPATGCDQTGLTLPVVEYTHAEGCSITGGVVYRGCRTPGYAGTYFYADFCSGLIRSFRMQGGQATDRRDWTAPLGRGVGNVTAFGLDDEGEVYIVDQDGEVYKVVPAS
ncbi:MAG TPA: PQQ-dependent sugar dehydrogenase [Vicinamibacteria bacterium]|nr:PQQ-dependent sugar dehydrogenase [Vicinamibacteria bacterium]